MVKGMMDKLKDIDKPVIKVMRMGLYFSLFVCMISAVILYIYEAFYGSPELYIIGLQTFKVGIAFFTQFIICGIAIDTIKKQIT